MKTLKLEVGKTYRSRKGEEVRIIRKADVNKYVYQGSNGEWYTESGRWEDFGVEDPLDLIEELPETRHTFSLVPEALTATRYNFAIPEGVKKVTVSQEGNRFVVEMVPEEIPEYTRILEWVEKHLNDVYYSKQCIAQVIETYLNYKEDAK